MKDVLVIFIVLLVLLTLISTFGGSIRQKERFYEVPKVPSTPSQPTPGVPMGLPPPPPEVAALLASSSSSNISDSEASEASEEENTVSSQMQKMKDALSKVPSMLTNDLQGVMPSITTMGAPQTALPSLLPEIPEKFENFQIEAFDNVESYAVY